MDDLALFKAIVRATRNVPAEDAAIKRAVSTVRALFAVPAPSPPSAPPAEERAEKAAKDRLERKAKDRSASE